MKRELLTKPLWSTALVATLLLGAITTTIGATLYLVERFAKVETAVAVLQSTVVTRDEFFALREQVFSAPRYTRKTDE